MEVIVTKKAKKTAAKAATKEEVEQFEKDATSFTDRQRQQRYTQLRGRRGQEVAMYDEWEQSGRDPAKLTPLLKSLSPMIDREAKKRMKGLGGSMPHSAVRGELQRGTVRALETYDPTKGTQLHTHIHQNFKRVTDFIAANRNPKYMPKRDVEKYQTFSNAKESFKQEFGRDPSMAELKQLLPSWGMNTLKKLDTGFGSEAFTNMNTGIMEHDPGVQPDALRNAFLLMKSTMSEEEKRFADMHYPRGGKRQMSVKQIARAMGVPEHKVYRIKERVEKRLAPVVKSQ